ncbi:hypothetical protein FN846DRAFT_921972 [Sphaerosporella brunnea]|uniref:Uncharacterized protein n=1 Tax=Sphaerosporella brunnea TaxID=1250544 RepID=A0A5J5ELH3_9PEZI|nr:hypothetical protein FN846DRAFT_921972 [Sphaerosporella brunnea]
MQLCSLGNLSSEELAPMIMDWRWRRSFSVQQRPQPVALRRRPRTSSLPPSKRLQKWTVKHENTDTVYARAKESLAKGEHGSEVFMDLLVVDTFEDGSGRVILSPKEDWHNYLLAVPAVDLLTIVKSMLD